MSLIRVVWGSATGPTAMAAYDAALARAGIENYNLVSVSSVIPAGVEVEAVGTAPDLGPAGERLTVVEARATARSPATVSAGLGWIESVDDGPGLFYEAAGEVDTETVERRVRDGLAAGADLREWDLADPRVRIERAAVDEPVDGAGREEAGTDPGAYATAVVLAVYGESNPIM